MLSPEPMARVTVAATRDKLEPIIHALYDAKLLHLSPHDPKGPIAIGSPLPEAERFSKLLLNLAGLRSLIPFSMTDGGEYSLASAEATETDIREAAQQAAARLRTAEEQARSLDIRIGQLQFLMRLRIRETKLLSGFGSLASAIGTVTNRAPVDQLAKQGYAIFRSPKSTAIAVFYPLSSEPDVKEALLQARFTPVAVPTHFETATIADELASVRRKRERTQTDMTKAQAELERLRAEHTTALGQIEAFANAALRKAEAPLQFAVSEYAFAVSGWAPRKQMRQLQDRIRVIDPAAYVHTEPAGETAPIQLKNPGPAKPLEFFLHLYSLPRYGEIDPTLLTFITFPLFYGMMLGDIGYGILIFAAFAFLRYTLPRLGNVFTVMMISALWTIGFGFLFGEFFGAEAIGGIQLHPVLHRLHDVSQLLIASLVFGIAHITISYLLGFVNEWHRHGPLKAFLAKGSWLLMEAGGLGYFLNLFHVISLDPIISLALVGSAVLLLVIGEGFTGLIEIPGLASNILSYTRLAAVGLASASLAVLANTMAGGLFAQGGFMWIAGAFVLIAIHTINILLGMLDSFLQSLRLHYVETFPKFYQGSGEAYKPFGS